MKRKKTALLNSVLSLILCISMLLGTTFAWFTDEVTSAGNIIKSGTLDVEMLWKNPGEADDAWQDASESTIFNYKYWEPGYVDAKCLKLVNAGDLAFQYRLFVVPNNDMSAGLKLAEVLDVYVSDTEIDERTDISGMKKLGTLKELMANPNGVDDGVLLPAGAAADNSVESYVGSATVCVALKMQETAGNEYQNQNFGDGFKVQLLATQYTYENDSFGANYDTNSVWPDGGYVGGTISGESVSGAVTTTDGKVDAAMSLQGNEVGALIPEGVKVNDGTTELTLTVQPDTRSSNISMNAAQVSRTLDVHIDGVAEDNDVPMVISLGSILPVGLKLANVELYHVENGTPVAMSLVDEPENHNEFSYDATTGAVTVALASFSEVTALVAYNNPWDGTYDYSWYTNAAAPAAEGTGVTYEISTAEQFAAFGAIVGGMSKDVAQDDFKGDTVKLTADLDLGSETGKVWYPIGYHNSTGSYDKVSGGSVTSNVSSFEGTFDGNGKTISNIYQNTWDMFGDYNNGYSGTPNHYKDGMGIFGFVLNGTVKDLTVDNFQSDGEFSTTGVVAAYAVGTSTFENITITNSNPRAYNVPNGGVVGYAYAEDGFTNIINFKNVKVDSSNKISALWGSWDVGCGGILGRVNGATTVNMTNCEVGAVIDVFNDVCGNYQYYQYRYAGMLIGTVGGDSDPKTGAEKVNFSNVKVYIGNWADYYFCEFEKNSGASYTEDFQFSRVEKSEIVFDDTTNLPKGCTHTHTVNEDKLAVYLPFEQLYTGYGWGSSPVKAADGVTVEKQFYSVTYMDATGKNVLGVAYVTEGERSESKVWADEYTVRTGSITPAGANQVFKYWVNAGSVKTTTIKAGNRNDIVLYESWDNPYVARFVDQFGNVIYSETFTKSNPTVSVPDVPEVDNCTGVWETYSLANATGDITIRPIYTYNGNLKLVPVDNPEDGIVDYYQIEAVSALDEITVIPGYFNGLPVKRVEKLYKNDGNWDFGSGVKTIIIEEGVEELAHNSLGYTADLDTVTLPNSLKKLEKNTFSRNTGDDKKTITIEYAGTMAEWQAVLKNSASDWHNGLKSGTKVICTDGYYELKSTEVFGVIISYKWTEYPNS